MHKDNIWDSAWVVPVRWLAVPAAGVVAGLLAWVVWRLMQEYVFAAMIAPGWVQTTLRYVVIDFFGHVCMAVVSSLAVSKVAPSAKLQAVYGWTFILLCVTGFSLVNGVKHVTWSVIVAAVGLGYGSLQALVHLRDELGDLEAEMARAKERRDKRLRSGLQTPEPPVADIRDTVIGKPGQPPPPTPKPWECEQGSPEWFESVLKMYDGPLPPEYQGQSDRPGSDGCEGKGDGEDDKDSV